MFKKASPCKKLQGEALRKTSHVSKVNSMFRSSPFLDVLKNRTFLALWLGQVASQLASNMTLFLLALVVYQNTGSNTAVSGLFIAYGVPAVFFGMLAGTVVDTVNKRSIILYSSLLRAFLVIGLLFLSHNVVFVYILLFLNSLVMQFFVPAEATMIPKLVGSQQLVTANSLFSFAFYSSMALGFILAGPLLRFCGLYGALAVLIALFLFATWTSLRLPRFSTSIPLKQWVGTVFRGTVVPTTVKEIREGIAYLFKSPSLFDAVLLLTGTQIMLAILGTLGPGFADRVMAIDVRDASLVIIGPAVIGMLAGAFLVGNEGKKYTPRHLIQIGIISAGVLLVTIAITVYLKRYTRFDWFFTDAIVIPVELFLFFLLGAANSLLDVPANSVLQKEAVGDMRGRMYGILAAFVGGVGIIPVLAGGLLADVIGVGKVIFFLGIFIICYGILRMRYNKRKT